ncbi:MAG: transaldolase [Chthoniobacter sp.]|nr:transaldolase [Chthoniobacter sp.]
MTSLHTLKTKIYADGADKAGMLDLYANPLIQGMTTNPTLMKKAGITDYEAFAKDVLQTVRRKPISFEVFADDFAEMRRQALRMRDWQENVYVKIPVLSPSGESAVGLIHDLAMDGVRLNVTAILTERQIEQVAGVLVAEVPSVVSIFAGRIADTGRDPLPIVQASHALLAGLPHAEVLWASVREVFNIFQAEAAGAHIVTVPHDILHKAIAMCGRDLDALSLDTVKMFDRDAKAAGYTLATTVPTAPAETAALRQAA